MNPPNPPPAPDQQIQITYADDYKETYANNVGVFTLFPWDLVLVFGVVTQQKAGIAMSQGVRISVQTAKVVAQILVNNVAAYEKQFGEIQVGAPTVAVADTGSKGAVM